MLFIVDKVLDTLNKTEVERSGTKQQKLKIKCKYFNRGFCRDGSSCNFLHPEYNCQQFCEHEVCVQVAWKDILRSVVTGRKEIAGEKKLPLST